MKSFKFYTPSCIYIVKWIRASVKELYRSRKARCGLWNSWLHIGDHYINGNHCLNFTDNTYIEFGSELLFHDFTLGE